jgi:hypothetical protein
LNKNEIEYLKYIVNLIRTLFGIEPKTKFRKSENTVDIQVFNKNLIMFLINKVGLQTSPKWGRAVIPCIYLNTKFEKDILRGYFDTDGSIVVTNNNGIIYPRLEMKICPSPMQSSFIEILSRRKFRFGVYQIGRNNVRIQMNGKTQLEKWLKEIGMKNSRCIEKVNKIAGEGFEPSTFGL